MGKSKIFYNTDTFWAVKEFFIGSQQLSKKLPKVQEKCILRRESLRYCRKTVLTLLSILDMDIVGSHLMINNGNREE